MTTSRLPQLLLTLALLASLALLPGCKTRSLPAIQNSGDTNFRYKDYDAALADYKEYIDRSPGNAEVQRMMGNTYVKLGQPALGAHQLAVAHTLRMEDDEIFADYAEALYQAKKYDELNHELRARTVGRGRMQDWALLAKYAEKLGDRDEAQRAWLTAAQVDGGKSVEPQLGLAKLYMTVGDTARARKRIAMAYYCDPTNGEVVALARQLNEVPGPTYGVPPEEQTIGGTTATMPQPAPVKAEAGVKPD